MTLSEKIILEAKYIRAQGWLERFGGFRKDAPKDVHLRAFKYSQRKAHA
jgi:hypothetical protein